MQHHFQGRRARTRKLALSATVAALLLGVHTAAAADAVADANVGAVDGVDVIGVRQGAVDLTVTSDAGSRLGLTALETPASIQIISGDIVRARGDATVAEALGRAAGVTIIPSPGNGGGALSARGFTGVNSIMQLYDGVQLFVGSGTVTFPFDPWTVDRIEVLGGPGSVLYGAGAIGGVVNVVPRSPSQMRSGELRLTGGSFETVRGALDLTGPLGDQLAYRLDVSGQRSDGWMDRGKSGSFAVSGSVAWQPSDTLTVTLSEDFAIQSPTRYFGTPLLNGVLDDRLIGKNFNVTDSAMRFRDSWTQLKAVWTPTDSLTIRNVAYALDVHRHWRNLESYSYQPTTGLIGRSSYVEIFHDEAQVGDHLDGLWKGSVFGLPNDLVVGLDVSKVRFKHTNNGPYGGSSTADLGATVPGLFVNLAGTTPRFISHADQLSVSAEDRLTLGKLAVVVGGRNDHYKLRRTDLIPAGASTRKFDAFSWRTGLVYQPTPNLSVYGQYAKAVDPVSSLITLNAAQQGFDLSDGSQWEGGIKGVFFGGRAQGTLAAYRIVKHKLLAPDPLRPTVQQQIGQQSSRGFEATLSVALTSSLRIDANAATVDAQFDDFAENVGGVATSRAGNRPPNVPKQTANLWLDWSSGRWSAFGGLRYVGSRFADNANTRRLPAYTVADLGGAVQLNASLALELHVNNALDKTYVITPSNGGAQWILGAPRAAEVTLHARF